MQPGENLLGAGVAPIRLSNASKLVYSPHVYGPSRFAAKEEPAHYADAGFPASCRDVWQRHFGYAREVTGRPVVVGEVGGTFKGRDKEFQQEFVAWAAEERLGLIYYALNPEGRGTGGILLRVHVEADAVDGVAEGGVALSPRVEPKVPAGRYAFGQLHALPLQLAQRARVMNIFSDPEQRVQITQTTLTVLNIRLQHIAGIAHAIVAIVALLQLRLYE